MPISDTSMETAWMSYWNSWESRNFRRSLRFLVFEGSSKRVHRGTWLGKNILLW
jgi:hypothetical protein